MGLGTVIVTGKVREVHGTHGIWEERVHIGPLGVAMTISRLDA